MQSDKKLLMLAARAAGITIDKSPYNGGGAGNTGFDISGNAVLDWHNGVRWSPLADDGDCARLEAACDLDVTWGDSFVRSCREMAVEPFWVNAIERFADHGGDKNKARRYASTRAAAQLAQQETAK